MKENNFNWKELPTIENNVYGCFDSLIKVFQEQFEKYCCHINIEQCWTTNETKKVYLERPPMETEYIYWLSYRILNKNKPIVYDEENSCLERAYGVVEVSKNCSWGKSKVKVTVIENLDDIENGLKEDLAFVRSIYQEIIPK